MVKVITYGTYDLLHEGHINLLNRAKELGDYLIVGVTSDSFDKGRGKLNVRNNVLERVEAVRATGLADEIIIEDYIGQKIDDIQRYEIDVFAVGSDWTGKFDYLKEYCKVIYLPRTEGISSTMLRESELGYCHIGIIGAGRIASRFVQESKVVNGVKVTDVFDVDYDCAQQFAKEFQIRAHYKSIDSFLDHIDAVYIASPHIYHYEHIKKSLLAQKHVLCEIPLVLSKNHAAELYNYASEHNLVLLEASKTAFCPAFNHLVTLIKSGIIGDVVDIRVALSKMVDFPSRELDLTQGGGAMNEHSSLTLMSIIKLLGVGYSDVKFYSKLKDGVDIYTKVILDYPHATSSATLGIGVKTEGNLVVSGTKGYVYVPAPWWLTSYFEVRYEDQTKNRKYFYSYDGEGLRYEIQEFASMIFNHRKDSYKLHRNESIKIAEIIEKFNSRTNFIEL